MIKSRFHINKHSFAGYTKNISRQHRRFIHHFVRLLNALHIIAGVLAVTASFFCLIVIVLYFGFERNINEQIALRQLLHIPQILFIVNILLNLFTGTRKTLATVNYLNLIVNSAVLISLITWIYPQPRITPTGGLFTILYNNAFLFIVLSIYSILEICKFVTRLIDRRTNPALILSASFIIVILIGSFILMLPKCTQTPISYYDSLFISTSAVCITGLCPVDIPTTFTPLGLLVLSLLIQVGGLGVITFTSFFAIFFSGSPSIYSQLLIKDVIYSKTINNLIPTLFYILAFTITVEAIGAIAVYFTIPPSLAMSFHDKVIFASFHSLSSFCNAGFSCLPGGMANPSLLNGTQSIYIVTSVLIFAGSIGFPILGNIKDYISTQFHRLFLYITHKRQSVRQLHIYDLNTKLVIVTTLSILVVGSVLFFIFEYNNTLAGMPLSEKIVQSVFNSLIPRSAGFSSVNPSLFLPVTYMLIIIQMWIGGASQSLAGGIKVNTFAVIILNMKAIIRGEASPSAFSRRISTGSVRRANAILAVALCAFAIYSFVILLLEPGLPVKKILFEVTSALFTVGSSLGITDQLSPMSKIVLSTAMFAGRVGILSLLIGFIKQTHDRSSHYPAENIIIN